MIWHIITYLVQKVFGKNINTNIEILISGMYLLFLLYLLFISTTSSQNSFQLGPRLDYELGLLGYGQIFFYFYL